MDSTEYCLHQNSLNTPNLYWIGVNFMTKAMESPAREAYRKMCRHYGVDGVCWKLSHSLGQWYGIVFVPNCGHISITCTPDCNCVRMKKYDEMNKHK